MAMERLAGITAIETRGLVTVSVVVPLMLLDLAVMVEVPGPTAVTRPCVPALLLMVATAVEDELHVTSAVRSWVLWSLKVPVAVNCEVVPGATEAAAVITAR